ncbi:MAG: tRNA (adenosine(37)-N6)-threonylcarbamoyltransferase complex ATPase subunit type 1 TsaE [Chloroherpetonaceae bacterium]|nr:tRNA (adenosine(37)-N6)-threonylcarbamoyltransferase complex ATPase subunit type 1 TsaE [Chloroherpetonaceae bacterium]
MIIPLILKNAVRLSHSPEESRELARQFGIGLTAGDIVLLSGDLGAGKTLFVKGICDVYHCSDSVTSPTFTIVNTYNGTLKGVEYTLHHFDLYRIESERELQNIGFDEYLYSNAISIIEWSEKFAHLFPSRSRKVFIDKADETKRLIRIE